jgi:hypothetical protein
MEYAEQERFWAWGNYEGLRNLNGYEDVFGVSSTSPGQGSL